MGGEVIIITQDPDLRTPPTDPPKTVTVTSKVTLAQVNLKFTDEASAADIGHAVQRALSIADLVKGG
jgi:hypothetical protein